MSKWRDITALQIRFIWKLGVDNYCYPASTRAASCATDLEVGGGRRAVTATSGMLCHSCSFPSLHTDDRRGSDRCRGRAEQVLSVIHSLTPHCVRHARSDTPWLQLQTEKGVSASVTEKKKERTEEKGGKWEKGDLWEMKDVDAAAAWNHSVKWTKQQLKEFIMREQKMF